MLTREDTLQDVVFYLNQRGLKMTRSALEPIQSLDFSRLVAIHDHEEAFLRRVFLSSLIAAHKARPRASGLPKRVNAQDIRSAMLMLGAAVSAADEKTFSEARKPIIRDICPYC